MGERTKNHQVGSEDLNNMIVFSKGGRCNTGRLFELYQQLLNPKCDRLFQKARTKSKSFDIHNFENTCLYENAPVGKHKVKENMKTLCAILDREELPNHSVRRTAIENLKRLGYDDREIMAKSGE